MDSFDLHEWLPEQLPVGSRVDQIVIDSRQISSQNALFVALPGKTHDGHAFISEAAQNGARFAIVDQHYTPPATLANCRLIRVQNPLRTLQELAAFYRKKQNVPVLAITGSFGKTTLKELLLSLLSSTHRLAASPESFNSQIGVPLSLLRITKQHDLAIIEAGISQIGEMEAHLRTIAPDFAALTTIGSAHLASLRQLETVAEEKIKLLTAPTLRWAILPDHPLLQPHLAKISAPRWHWNQSDSSLPHASWLSTEPAQQMRYTIRFPDDSSFEATVSNGFTYILDIINIAIRIAYLLGVPAQTIAEKLRTYTPKSLEMHIWRSPHGITFFHEPYGSTTFSIARALRAIRHAAPEGRRLCIFGGEDSPAIGKAIASQAIDTLILSGDHPYPHLMQTVQAQNPTLPIHHCPDAFTLQQTLEKSARHGDALLIKTASKKTLETIQTLYAEGITANQLIINLSAVQTNLETFRALLPSNTRLISMIKANGYGTDALLLARYLVSCGIDIFGVAYIDEAVHLRRGGIAQDIFVINATTFEIPKIIAGNFQIAVSDLAFINALASHNHPFYLHLHVDTGMSRLGCRPEEALALAQAIQRHPNLILEGIMTHLAAAEEPTSDAFSQQQIATLDKVIATLAQHNIHPRWRHAANSPASLRFSPTQYNMARIGLSLLGISPSAHCHTSLPLQPAITLLSKIVGINSCRRGETVSYSRTHVIDRDNARIAVIPLGYFDGIHRRYSNKAFVRIRGQTAPIIGTICMDYLMIDISHIPTAQVGDEVLLFGKDAHGATITPEEFAAWGDGSVYELITCLGPRIPRRFVCESWGM